MDKIDEIKKLAEKAEEEIRELEQQFNQVTETLTPLLGGEHGRFGESLKKEIQRSLNSACHQVRFELVRHSVAILKGREPQ